MTKQSALPHVNHPCVLRSVHVSRRFGMYDDFNELRTLLGTLPLLWPLGAHVLSGYNPV